MPPGIVGGRRADRAWEGIRRGAEPGRATGRPTARVPGCEGARRSALGLHPEEQAPPAQKALLATRTPGASWGAEGWPEHAAARRNPEERSRARRIPAQRREDPERRLWMWHLRLPGSRAEPRRSRAPPRPPGLQSPGPRRRPGSCASAWSLSRLPQGFLEEAF